MTDQLFYLFSALLLGLVIGAMIMYFTSGSNKDSAKTIEELESKIRNYQNDVAEHFEKTADLVDELTQSYKNVFDHLGKSARELMTDDQIKLIEKRKSNKVTLEFLRTEEELNIEDDNEELEELLEKVSEEHKEESLNSEVAQEDTIQETPEEEKQADTQKKKDKTTSDDSYDENSYV
jgi:hypothetical protein